jgi:Protein of unknown function (DUF2971).
MSDNYTMEYVDGGKMVYPKIIYKYRDWDNPYHQKILRENKIFLSSPRDFEDDMDCNVPESFPKKEELYNFFLEKSKEEIPNASRQECRAFARHWSKHSPLANPTSLKRQIEHYNNEFNDRFGVCSLTADSENADMWEKYANDSKGICIGFDSSKLFGVVGGGGEVIYVEELPTIDFVNDDFKTKHGKNIFFKENKWAFEKEYRLHKFWKDSPKMENRNILMLEDCIVEVILGKDISEENKKEIIELLHKQNPNITIKQSTI